MSTVGAETQAGPKSKKYRKDKPWDDPSIDHWKIDPIDPNQIAGPFLEESSFSVLFPQYREKYVQECQGLIKKRLMELGVKFELNLLEGSMTVRTTKKTWDPYAIIKARDVIRLIARSVPYQQALRLMQDGVFCEVVKIRSYVRNKERFIKRRQRLMGPNGDTLKALELLTNCYILVQGSTVSMVGNFKDIKVLRRIVVDTMQNVHPVYHIKELMVKRELMKDEGMREVNWDKFLPKFKQVRMNRKKSKSGPQPQKKQYQTFPPEPTPRQEDIKMETGEYFLSEKEVKERALDIKRKKQEKVRRQKQREQEQDDEEQHIEQELEKDRQRERKSKKASKGEATVEELKQKFLTKPVKTVSFA